MKKFQPQYFGALIPMVLFLAASPLLAKEDAAECAKQILDHPSYQKELLKFEIGDARPPNVGFQVKSREKREGAGFGAVLLYMGLFLLVVLALVWGWDNFYSQKPQPEKNQNGLDEGAAEHGKDPSLKEIENLAMNQRFDDAVRSLLLLAVKRLSALQMKPPPQEMTSRELVRLLPRNPEEKGLFKHLVHAVEISLFGGRPIDASDYHICLEKYRGLNL